MLHRRGLGLALALTLATLCPAGAQTYDDWSCRVDGRSFTLDQILGRPAGQALATFKTQAAALSDEVFDKAFRRSESHVKNLALRTPALKELLVESPPAGRKARLPLLWRYRLVAFADSHGWSQANAALTRGLLADVGAKFEDYFDLAALHQLSLAEDARAAAWRAAHPTEVVAPLLDADRWWLAARGAASANGEWEAYGRVAADLLFEACATGPYAEAAKASGGRFQFRQQLVFDGYTGSPEVLAAVTDAALHTETKDGRSPISELHRYTRLLGPSLRFSFGTDLTRGDVFYPEGVLLSPSADRWLVQVANDHVVQAGSLPSSFRLSEAYALAIADRLPVVELRVGAWRLPNPRPILNTPTRAAGKLPGYMKQPFPGAPLGELISRQAR